MMKKSLCLLMIMMVMFSACAADKDVEIQNQPSIESDESKTEQTVEEQVHVFLKENGFPEIQIAGILANIKCQSNFQVEATDPNEIGYGLLQWCRFRKANLEEFAFENSTSIDNLEIQLKFLVEELNPESEYFSILETYQGYEAENFWNACTPEEAAENFCMVYVRPHHMNAHLKEWANEYYKKYRGVEI